MDKENKIDLNYIYAFFGAFLIFALTAIPSLVLTKGVWLYYGDFNVQQIPFYMHAHEAIRQGNFLYDWGTDLGGSLIGMYSFYLLGSPFFWITLPFKTEAVPYLMPWLTALKYAVMALTAYAYMKRHMQKKDFALIGAFLYAFSGFQGAVLVYNHFHDVLAFFPLYLILFERMIEKKKILGFTLMTSFMLILNYYFFVGEVVFLVIYYFTMYKPKFKDLLRAFFTGLSGVLLSGAYILPAVYYTLGNGRLTDTLNGYDLVAYSESTMLLGIIKNVVMLPDVSGLNSMLNQNFSRVSGVGAYIPLFSVAGVVAYFLWHKEKDGLKRLIITCLVFAAFPVLNALFSALNSEFYARWYYMPVLIMAMMTAKVLEEREETAPFLKKGVYTVTVITLVISIMAILPAKKDDETWTVLGALKNYEQLISEIIFSFVMLFFLYIYVMKLIHKSDRFLKWTVAVACLVTTATMFVTGTLLVDKDRKTDFVAQAVQGESPLDYSGDFYRFETDEDFYNYPLMWDGSHCITSFISTINNSTLEFYDKLSVRRKVTSNLYTSRIGMRALLSSKYFLTNNMHSIEFIGHVEDMKEIKDYNIINKKNGFNIYENDNFIPMGFTFDYFVTEESIEEAELQATALDRLLVRAIILSKEDASKYSNLLQVSKAEDYQTTALNVFEKECEERAKTACTSFEADTYGFIAKTTLEKDSLVFFSVPYEEGFTAYVDGVETGIVKADYGFMAVPVSKGTHTIEFKYTLSGLRKGIYMSLTGMGIFFILIIFKVYEKEKEKKGVD